jgi:hypothetical protein
MSKHEFLYDESYRALASSNSTSTIELPPKTFYLSRNATQTPLSIVFRKLFALISFNKLSPRVADRFVSSPDLRRQRSLSSLTAVSYFLAVWGDKRSSSDALEGNASLPDNRAKELFKVHILRNVRGLTYTGDGTLDGPRM